MTPDQLERLSNRHGEQHQAILVKLLQVLWNLWRPFTGWYDDDQVTARAARSASLVEAANLQVFLLAREFTQQVSIANGRALVDLPPADPLYPRANTTPIEVYTRPAEQFRYARSQGEPPEVALEAALERVGQVAQLDLAATRRRGFDDALVAVRAKFYRRVIHPEMSKGGTCGLCIAASTRVYRVGDLLPIHGGCHCDAVEIGPGDVADVLNGADLKALYTAAGSTGATDLARTRYRIDEHDELGPVLVAESATESGAHRRARTRKSRLIEPGPQQWRAELEVLTGTEARLAARLAAGEDVAQPLAWQRDRLALLRDRLAKAA